MLKVLSIFIHCPTVALIRIVSMTVATYTQKLSELLFASPRLTEALQSAMSLELGPRGLLVFEDYAKGNAANTHTRRKGIPGGSL